MITHDLQALIPRFLKTTRLIWFAFIGGPVIYAVLTWYLVSSRTEAFEPSLPPEGLYALIAIAVVSGPVFSWVIAPLIAGPKKMVSHAGDTQLVTDFGDDQARYERLSETDKKRAQLLGAIQSSHIVRWAGAESVAIYGMIGIFTGIVSLQGAWIFQAAAILLLMLLRPDYESYLENLSV